MKKGLRFLPVALFAAVTLLDLLLQQRGGADGGFAFTHPLMDCARLLLNALKYGLLWGAFGLLMGRWARVLYLPLWIWMCFLETAEIFARRYYNMVLDGDWLMLVLASSVAEMREMFAGFGPLAVLLGLGGFALAASAGGWALWRATDARATRRSVACGIICLAPFFVWNVIVRPLDIALSNTLYTFLPVDTACNWSEFSDIARTAQAPELPAGLRAPPRGGDRPFGLFVIGESATRAHWDLYGYGRSTTPCLVGLRDELTVFGDVSATDAFTGKSLRMLLTEAKLESPARTRSTLAQQLAAAGLRSRLISAQSRWGRWEGPETLLFSGCEDKTYLSELPGRATGTEGPFDGDLLPLLDAALAETNAPDAVFLHLMGSHTPTHCRYPPRCTVYPRHTGDVPPGTDAADAPARARIDTYDNSIRYTDGVLGELVNRLKARKGPSFLLYLSDHGETPDGPAWRDASRPELLQVPFVIWFSPAYRAAHPDVVAEVQRMAELPLRLDHALPLMRQLMCVEAGR